MRHSKRPHYSPVNYHPSPRSGLVHLFTSHLSPLSAQRPPLSAQRRASGYQNRVHKNHEYLITCPHGPISRRFLSDRLRTWGNASRPRRSRGWSSARNIGGSAQQRRMPAREQAASKSICRNGEDGPARLRAGAGKDSRRRACERDSRTSGPRKSSAPRAAAFPSWRSWRSQRLAGCLS